MITRDQAIFLDDHGDDLYGIWEVGWYFCTKKSLLSESEQKNFVSELINMGLIDTYYMNGEDQHRTVLNPKIAHEIVMDVRNWDAPVQGFEGNLAYIKESKKGKMLREKFFPSL